MDMLDRKSELKQLLEKDPLTGLTEEECARVLELIADPIISNDECLFCMFLNPDQQDNAIFDTDVCADHARFVISVKKMIDH